ncbi:MAG: YdcF family protein [Oscillospiraceae bacterium]|nr:YdcF family protein [Oscillospiraceae bacterium]
MKRKFLKTILCLLVAAAVCLLAVALSIAAYGNRDEKQPSDAVIVLGAGSFSGEISPVFRERINHGIWLYDNGYADFIIFTGGFGVGSSMSDAASARDYALSCGVPEEAIYIEESSVITEENLFYAKQIMDENAWETAIIVSDPLHMKRAMLMAKDCGIEALSSPTPTTMYRSFKTQFPFLMREEFYYIGYCIVRIFR